MHLTAVILRFLLQVKVILCTFLKKELQMELGITQKIIKVLQNHNKKIKNLAWPKHC